ncbi:hypothetical protein EHM69_11395 [candidate division KSB1 bacterium]|nr:MAG: hypothetical protein EHM69_11395 [candidate division KSB1 bacterium]
MEQQERRTADRLRAVADGEQGVSPQLLNVRTALLNLPKTECSVGFEFRLQRRIQEMESGVRVGTSRPAWGLGWAGVGLGFAAAFVVAVVAFDFSFSSGRSQIVSAPIVSGPSRYVPPNVASQTISAPSVADTLADVVKEEAPKMAAVKDSQATKNPPANLPENLFHMVGGNNP